MYSVLLLGDAGQDLYHYGSCDRLSPEAPVPVLKHLYSESRDGMCLNVRNNLSAFGINVQTLSNKRMIKKERFVDLKTKQHLLRADFGEDIQLEPCKESEINIINFDKLDAIVIADYNKGFINKKNIEYLLNKVNDHNINVFVDSKKSDLSCYEKCILKINKLEFNKVKALPNDYEIIVSAGEEGAIWRDKVYQTQACEVFDVSGAGDTFLSGLVYQFLKTKSLDQAIEYANKCARVVVVKFGTYTLTKKDIEDLNNKR